MENARGSVDSLGLRIHLAKNRGSWMCWELSYRTPGRSSLHRDKKLHRATGSAPGQLCPKSLFGWEIVFVYLCLLSGNVQQKLCLTCIVTTRSSTTTSFVKKSAPIVALYWLENRLFTYWFISDVLPTEESPRMMTFSKTFFLDDIFDSLILRRRRVKGRKWWRWPAYR